MRVEGVMEGFRAERRNREKDVKGFWTEGRRGVWEGEGEGIGRKVRRKESQEVREKDEEEGEG